MWILLQGGAATARSSPNVGCMRGRYSLAHTRVRGASGAHAQVRGWRVASRNSASLVPAAGSWQ